MPTTTKGEKVYTQIIYVYSIQTTCCENFLLNAFLNFYLNWIHLLAGVPCIFYLRIVFKPMQTLIAQEWKGNRRKIRITECFSFVPMNENEANELFTNEIERNKWTVFFSLCRYGGSNAEILGSGVAICWYEICGIQLDPGALICWAHAIMKCGNAKRL